MPGAPKNKAIGCLAGCLFGSVVGMGAPAYLTPEQIRQQYPLKEYKGIPIHYEYSMDYNFAMMAYSFFMRSDEYTPDKFATHIIRNMVHRRMRAQLCDNELHESIEAILEGKDPAEAGRDHTSASAAIMAVPMGVLFKGGDYADAVMAVTIPTHNTDMAISGAMAAAHAAHAASEDKTKKQIIEQAYQIDNVILKQKIREVMNAVAGLSGAEEVADAIAEHVQPTSETIDVVPAALAIFYCSNGSPEDACMIAWKLGGDVEQVCCLANSLIGAWKGDIFSSRIAKWRGRNAFTESKWIAHRFQNVNLDVKVVLQDRRVWIMRVDQGSVTCDSLFDYCGYWTFDTQVEAKLTYDSIDSEYLDTRDLGTVTTTFREALVNKLITLDELIAHAREADL